MSGYAMKKIDRSYGIIPFARGKNGWKVLLIQHRHGGHWAFPKGHAEGKENAMEAARRELFEETGLQIAIVLSDAPLEESYEFRWQGQMIKKTVQYFACTVEGELVLQAEEISKAKWLSLDAAEKQLTHSASKLLLSTSRNLLATQDQTASEPGPEQG